MSSRLNESAGRSLLFFAAMFFAIASVNGATFTVTNDADSGAGSLRQAILDSNASGESDVIEFDSTFFSTPRMIVLTSGDLQINTSGNVSIVGPGASLLSVSGNNQTRVFSIASVSANSTVSISGLTIRDGDSIGSTGNGGGGIAVNPSSGANPLVILSLSNVVITENEGRAEGGGIWMFSDGSLEITDSVISRNSAGSGGGIDCGSGSGFCVSVSIVRTTFDRNDADIGGGGGFVCCGNSSGDQTPISIESSVFSNNTSIRNGSAFRSTNEGMFSFKNTTFYGNHATSEGPTLQLNRAPYTFENVTIAYNTTADAFDSAGVQWSAGNTGLLFARFRNSIVSNNFNSNGQADINMEEGTLESLGYNIFGVLVGTTAVTGVTTGNQIGVDPKLDQVLRSNGGPTKTLALRRGSPAIDAGDPGTFEATDQRGIARPADGDGNGSALPDIGAYERTSSDVIRGVPADFDGDEKTDISIFRPNPSFGLKGLAPEGSSSQWWLLRSGDLSSLGLTFGTPADTLVPGDYTGDGKADLAFFRPSTSEWYVLRSEDFSFYAFPFGAPGDVPAPGDFDGDGVQDAAVYRPSTGIWYILRSSDSGVTAIPFGIPEDQPTVADFDADGRDDIAVYRPSVNQWWQYRSSAGVIGYQFGSPGDVPAVGDYTGDGKADIAFYRPSTSEWYVIRSEDQSFYAFPWGAVGDLPAQGDYDGDGITDAGVFRGSDSTWYINRSSEGFLAAPFGTAGDVPVPGTVN